MQVVAHSVGTWSAYEFLMLARDRGLPMPKHIFLSAMAAPDIPEDRRPWRKNRDLDEDSFKVKGFIRRLLTDADAELRLAASAAADSVPHRARLSAAASSDDTMLRHHVS